MTKGPDPDIRSNARAATGPTNRTAAIGESRPPHAIARGRSRPGQHSAPGTDDPNEVRPNNPARLPAAPQRASAANGNGSACNRCFRSRSEEHTSELQSLMRISYAVFCLKKTKTTQKTTKAYS